MAHSAWCYAGLAFIANTLVAFSPATAALPPKERDALVALDGATGHVLRDSRGWNGAPGTECSGSWAGVTCVTVGTTERVALLRLGRHQINLELTGSLPDAIGDLGELTQLELTDQHLSGQLPLTLDKLVKMARLDFRGNSFTGGNAQTSGLAPFMAMTGINFLNLEGNSVAGPIPASIGALTQLKNLELTGNSLTGAIPHEIGQLANLEKLWLDANQLDGEIPTEIGNFPSLLELRLGGNNLVGAVPPTIGSLHSLVLMQIGLCNLSGPLPATIAQLHHLEELSLGTNRIGGGLDAVDWSQLSHIRKVFLDHNDLTGPVPAVLFSVTSLSELRLEGNALSGEVPRGALSATGISVLDLRWNALTADGDVAQRLDALSSGEFTRTQTIAPAGLAATGTTVDGIRLSWTPVTLQDAAGGYLIDVQRLDGPGGSLPPVTVPDKTVSASDIRGLVGGATYELTVRTFTNPHASNPNSVVSAKSTPVTGSPAIEVQRGQIALAQSPSAVAEGQILRVAAVRTDGIDGSLHVEVSLLTTGVNPARIGRDVRLLTRTLDWSDGEGGTKDIQISAAFDSLNELTETVQLKLQANSPSLISGTGTSDLEVLDRTLANNVESSVVASNDNGLEMTVYVRVENDGVNRDITGRFTAGLMAGDVRTEFEVTAEPKIDELDPAVFPVGDTFEVVWEEASGDKRPLRFCEIDRKTGGCKRKKSLVVDNTTKGFDAVDDGNTFWLTWHAASGIHLAHFDRQGKLIGATEVVATEGSPSRPRVSRLGSSGVFIAWAATAIDVPGRPEAQRPVLRGRTFVPSAGLGALVDDLAGDDQAEVRNHQLLRRSDGSVLLSWIGVTVQDTDSGPRRDGPQILLQSIAPSGAPLGSRSAAGCESCGDALETYTIVRASTLADCVATWVAIPGAGALTPVVRRATLVGCEIEQSEIQLQLNGPPIRVRDVNVGSKGATLAIIGQTSTAATLILRGYRCAGDGTCQN